MRRTEQSFKSFSRSINLAQSCLWKFNQTAELMGGLGDTMGRLMQPVVEFEQSMANLSSITGIAGKDLERLGKIAKDTGGQAVCDINKEKSGCYKKDALLCSN